MRWFRALFALLVSIVLLGGVPLLLLKVIGNPWAGVREMFTAGTMTDQGVLDVLAVLVIGAAAVGWLQFAAAFAAEFASVRRTVKYGQRSTRPRHVPLVLKGQQRLAHSLVTALLLLGPTLLSTLGPSVAAVSAAVPAPAVMSSATAGEPGRASTPQPFSAHQAPSAADSTRNAAHAGKASMASVTVTSDGPRNWWDLAQHYLGAGDRWQQLWNLNQGNVQADGTVMNSSTIPLQTGWVIRLPADAKLPPNPAATFSLPTTQPRITSQAPAGDVRVKVVPGDTLSGIVQRVVGDGSLYPAVAAADHIADPNQIVVGDTITIPKSLVQQVHNSAHAAPDNTVRLQPGETLSDVALREWGDADLWPVLAKVNHITDPENILAGSPIVIPASRPPSVSSPTSSVTPTTTGGRHVQSSPHPTTPAPSTPNSTPSYSTTPKPKAITPHNEGSVPAAPAGTPAPAGAASSTPAVAPALTTQPPAQTGIPQPTSEQVPGVAAGPPPAATLTTLTATPTAHGSAVAAASDSSEVSSVAALLGITAVAAGAVWGGLVLARRRGHRGRRPGRQSAPPSLPQVRAEKTLRDKAAEVDVAWLDMALRSLGTVLAGAEEQVPDILGATLSPAGMRLQLSTPAPAPDPFVADGAAWLLSAAAELPITADGAPDQLAPLPTLTSIGSRDGETVFVDLERFGAVNLTGDPDACRGLLTHIATELAHQSWSDGLNVTLVGWGRKLVALNSERLAYAASTGVVLRALQARVAAVPAALGTLGTNVLRARSGDIAGDSWTPQVLLIDASNIPAADLDQLQAQLVELAGVGRIATAVVMTGGGPSTAEIAAAEVTAAGVLRLPRLFGEGTITAACMTAADVDLIIELFERAEQVDHPIPASDVNEPWAIDMDRSGALLPALAMEEPVDFLDAMNNPARADADLPISASTAHLLDQDRLAKVMSVDPTLDDDLAEWWSRDTPRRPRISILGTAEVAAAGETPKRLAWFTEVVVYLALHRGGVSLDKFTIDLWPAEGRPGEARQIARSTRNETVSKIRRWLGTDPATGEPYVPLSTDGTYKLEDRLLDVELMQRLRKRGDARLKVGDPSGIEDYEAALKLIRGRPLPESTRVLPTVPRIGTGWGWLCNENRGEDLLMPGWVVDVAHRAVQAALSVNDLDKARWAANLGHEVDSYSDVPLTDLMIVAAAAGDMATANRHAWEVVWAYDKDNAEALPEHTYNIISRVFPDGLLAVSP